ncbi:Glutathione S-transferase [Porphyridium purpureum]|uniref:Glutathione S-transferase n=1 Tax=Porphyridium purpureum TaxID=35688 RepID=A0A5J4YUK8_PORPP|nr:Glutathione S-transferase [Porphyridium purpureum]|eukprot:POR3160..scf227_4
MDSKSCKTGKMAPRTYKLSYLPFKGRAESVRIAFFVAGIEFEDERIPLTEFGERKKDLPLGQLPVLTIDGSIVITQQVAILEYVGAQGGLVPTDHLIKAYNDEIINLLEDLTYRTSATIQMPEEKKKEARAILNNHTIPKYAKALDGILATHDKKHAVRAQLSTSDILINRVVEQLESGMLDGISKDILKPYAHIQRVQKAFLENEKIKQYFAKVAK